MLVYDNIVYMTNPNTPGSSEIPKTDATPDSPHNQIDTTGTNKAITALLQSEMITDPVDKRRLEEAMAFLESPESKSDVAGLIKHSSNVAEVMGGYEMQGQEAPKEIDGINLQLTKLLCQAYIDEVKKELKVETPHQELIAHGIKMALDVAKVLSKGYKDETYLGQVLEMQKQIG